MNRREPSIMAELARVDLQRDCEAADYTPDDLAAGVKIGRRKKLALRRTLDECWKRV